MNRTLFRSALATAFLAMACTAIPSQPPPQAPKALAIIRNDSTSQVTFEYRSGDTWQKVTLDSQKDANIGGDRASENGPIHHWLPFRPNKYPATVPNRPTAGAI